MFYKTTVLAFLALGILTVGCENRSSAPEAIGEKSQVLQCHKDTDCKGDRICESGTCTNPTPTNQVISDQADPLPKSSEPPIQTTAAVPKFKDYPSGPLYTGAPAPLADKNDDFRTRHANALAENEIVFASEYVISTIGCGTGCVFQSFLSKRTGEQLKGGFGGEGGEKIKEVRANSRLVVTAGPNDENEDDPSYYAYFYALENGEFKRLAKLQTALPECEGSSFCTVETPY